MVLSFPPLSLFLSCIHELAVLRTVSIIAHLLGIGGRASIRVFNGKHAATICNRCRAGEGNPYEHFFEPWEAFFPCQISRAPTRPRHYLVEWLNLGAPQEDYCSRIVHGEGQGKSLTTYNFWHCISEKRYPFQ